VSKEAAQDTLIGCGTVTVSFRIKQLVRPVSKSAITNKAFLLNVQANNR